MKRYKVRQIIRFLEKDGWRLRNCKGDHRQYVHPEKSGKVTVRGKLSDNLDQFLLNSIWKQAGWKRKKAPEEPPTGENGKKGKERAEG